MKHPVQLLQLPETNDCWRETRTCSRTTNSRFNQPCFGKAFQLWQNRTCHGYIASCKDNPNYVLDGTVPNPITRPHQNRSGKNSKRRHQEYPDRPNTQAFLSNRKSASPLCTPLPRTRSENSKRGERMPTAVLLHAKPDREKKAGIIKRTHRAKSGNMQTVVIKSINTSHRNAPLHIAHMPGAS